MYTFYEVLASERANMHKEAILHSNFGAEIKSFVRKQERRRKDMKKKKI